MLSRSLILGIAFTATLVMLAGCDRTPTAGRTRTAFVLDTACTITLYDRAPSGTLTRAFGLLRHINDTMTIDGNESEVIDVNRAAGEHPVTVSGDTYAVVKDGLRYSRLTGGAFDITVGPLVQLWGIGRGGEAVPPKPSIDRALSLVGYRDVVLDDTAHTVYLKRKGMVLDLGGIAKGYAGDAVRRLLEKEGLRHAIVDLGGNIVAMGSKPDGSLWKIGIQDPNRSRGDYIGVVSVAGKSVVTSGKYERYFTANGRRYHHILSTATGFPVENGISSVTIVSADPTTADALSTSLFLLGIRKGIGLVETLEDTEAVILSEDKKVYVSGGLRETFRITDPEYSLASPVH